MKKSLIDIVFVDGSIIPLHRQGGSKRKIDIEALKKYVESNENMTLKDASKALKVSIFTISHWLKKLGYSYKKKNLPTWKQMKKTVRN
ncbi:MAG: IS630 transposase-related protein [Rickettsiaceae bacterium]